MQSQLKSQQTFFFFFFEIEKLTLKKKSYGNPKELGESKQTLKRRKIMEE